MSTLSAISVTLSPFVALDSTALHVKMLIFAKTALTLDFNNFRKNCQTQTINIKLCAKTITLIVSNCLFLLMDWQLIQTKSACFVT
jgi:hypothetical protein